MSCNVAEDPSHQATTSPNDAQLPRNSRFEEPDSPENATEGAEIVAYRLSSDWFMRCDVVKDRRV